MKTPQVTESLQRLFTKEKNRIVFWYDPEREFEESLDSLELDSVELLRLDEIGSLALKIRLEMEDTTNKYLVYSPQPEPRMEEDWLLDIRLYSRTFHADKASIIIDELGLTNQTMRDYITQRDAFFRSQERLARIAKWIRPEDKENELDLKMMTVLARAEQPKIFSVLMAIFGDFCRDGECSLDRSPKSWGEIEKYGLVEPFWTVISQTFGYTEKEASLVDLLIRLFVTDFAQDLKGDLPQAMRHFLLTDRSLALDASVFLSQWRSNISHRETYNAIERCIAAELKVSEQLHGMDEANLIDVMTFEEVEKQIARSLRDYLAGATIDLNRVQEIIHSRRSSHWVRTGCGEDRIDFKILYDALDAAASLLDLRSQKEEGLSYPSAGTMYEAYTKELFRFDQLYRLFHEAAGRIDLAGVDILKELRKVVEDCYSGWYIDQLAVSWGEFISLKNGGGLLENWSIKDIPNQQDFHSVHVDPLVKAAPQSKVYVLISDAFRYEVAEEMARDINSRNRFKATLSSQLGVLPSYTGLGMASLLPHKTLEFKDNANIDLMVDGQPSSSLEQRKKILSSFQGTAIKAKELMTMSRDEGREFVKDHQIIYVYHNEIDDVGDSATSESKTFNAVRNTLNDLGKLVAHIINNLNGSQVLVTADHGFLYQDSPLEAQDKSGLDVKPSGTKKSKKRYLLGTKLGKGTNVWHGSVSTTAGTEGDMEFWVPRGANRFHFAGGARFVHGGAMPQEIVVPVISIKGLRGKEAEKATIKKVGVSLLSSIRKVVNNVERFEFIQTDAVSERMLPHTLLVSLRDGDELISNEVTLTFDSSSQSMDERKKSAQIKVKAGQYDKNKEYSLVLREADTKIEFERISVTIDLMITSDF